MEKRERNQRRGVEQSGRDQRIFASSIRSALGGQRPRPANRRNNEQAREVQPSYQSIDEALNELSQALEQPSICLDEFGRSFSLKKNFPLSVYKRITVFGDRKT
jgi:hypothetical protein